MLEESVVHCCSTLLLSAHPKCVAGSTLMFTVIKTSLLNYTKVLEGLGHPDIFASDWTIFVLSYVRMYLCLGGGEPPLN